MTVFTITNKNISDLSFLKEGTFVYDAALHQGFVVNDVALLSHNGIPLNYDQLAYGVFRDRIISVTPDKIAKTIFKKDFFLAPTYVITENVAIGTVVGVLTKSIDIPTYTYSLINYADTFEIVGNELKTKGQIDYDTRISYTLQIKIQDNLDSSRVWLETIHIDVLNMADTITMNANRQFTLIENTAIGTVVGNLRNMFNSESNLHTQLSIITFADTFEIIGDNLVVKGILDYETIKTYAVNILIHNIDIPTMSWNMIVTIDISNVFDYIRIVPGTFNITENSPNGTVVGNLAQFVTIESGFTVNYSTTSTFLTTSGSNLVVNGPVDYELATQHIVPIKVSSSSNPSKYWMMDITLNVLDVPDSINLLPDANRVLNVNENSAVGTIVGNLKSLYTTPVGLNTSLTLLDNTTMFAISGSNLTVKGTLDYELIKVYNITVKITDTVRPTVTVNMTVRIDINNIAEGPTEYNPGSLYVIGDNTDGALGIGLTPTLQTNIIKVGSATNWKMIASHSAYTMAIKSDGTLWGWGNNSYGNLGNGTTTNITTPTKIGTDTNWKLIYTGSWFCVAIKTDGTLWTWGANFWFGNLGHGDIEQRYVPTKVGTATNWKMVSTYESSGSVLAIRTDGTLWAWGHMNTGQLGLGIEPNIPTKVGTANTWKTVSTGPWYTVAIQTNGSLWMAGDNRWGALTINGWTSYEFIRIGTDNDWAKASACGYSAVLAIKTNGSMWGWGYSVPPVLGIPDNRYQQIVQLPTEIDYTTDWVDVSVSSGTPIGYKKDGSVWIWSNFPLGLFPGYEFSMTPVKFGTTPWNSVVSVGGRIMGIR